MMSSPMGKSLRGRSSQTAGALSLLSCSACVTGITDVPFDLQLLLHDSCQRNDLLMNAGCEHHACKRDLRRFRLKNCNYHPVLLRCDRCLHASLLVFDQVTFLQFGISLKRAPGIVRNPRTCEVG